jgi:tetratricopeptide (TPR) repeat protein
MARHLSSWAAIVASVFILLGCQQVKARHRMQEANKLYFAGKYDEAIREYEQALAQQPKIAVGWYNLALSHLAVFAPGLKSDANERHALGAINALQKYLELEPNDSEARKFLVSTYVQSGHYEGALDYFKGLLAKNPGDVNAMAQLADIYSRAGNFTEAVNWYRKRADLEPTATAKADAFEGIGGLAWRRLYNHPELAGLSRIQIADEGLAALQQADRLRKDFARTLTFMNLLYRERALGHESSYARAVDQATAQFYYKRAQELAKAQAVPKGGTK